MNPTTLGPPRPTFSNSYEPDELPDEILKGMDLPSPIDNRFYGYVPVLTVGCLVCFIIIVEGLFVVGNTTDPVDSLEKSIFLGLDVQHPLYHTQYILLTILAIGDLVLPLWALAGLVLTKKQVFVSLSVFEIETDFATLSLGTLLGWRILITCVTAPWVGTMLAFATVEYNKGLHIFGTMFYIALSAFIAWILVPVFNSVMCVSQELKQQRIFRAAHERGELLRSASLTGYPDVSHPMSPRLKDHPLLFGCIPLQPAVALGTVVLSVLSFIWFVQRCMGHTIGGWVFFRQAPDVNCTIILEFIVYLLTLLLTICAAVAILIHDFQGEREHMLYNLKLCAITILVYLMFSVMRFCLFIPITGMVLATKDVCGFYVQGLSSISTFGSEVFVPLHCTTDDWITLTITLGLIVLDGCFNWAIYELWNEYRTEFSLGSKMIESSAYGSTDPNFPVEGVW